MRRTGLILGVFAGIFSIVLWVVLVFYNPYTTASFDQLAMNTFILLCLPACLAIISAIMNKTLLMLIAFLWSLPISIYLSLTPGIFSLVIVPCIVYFICFLLFLFSKNKAENNAL